MRVLVTGGAGFIGHHLVQGLLRRGDAVRVLDNFSTGTAARLAPFAGSVEVIEGDILDRRALDRATEGCDVVLHHAALVSVARSMDEPRLTNDLNVNGTVEVVEAAARAGAARVILASSSAVYGMPEAQPCRETQRADPVSPYGASKLAAEHYLHSVGAARGVGTVALRYFNVFGPGQDPASPYAAVVPRFMSAIAAARALEINGSGEQTRDFTYVGDVVDANLRAATADLPAGSVLNVAAGRATTVNRLADAVGDALGREVRRSHRAARPQEVEHSWADVARARDWLGHASRTGLDEGLRRTAAAFAPAGAASAA